MRKVLKSGPARLGMVATAAVLAAFLLVEEKKGEDVPKETALDARQNQTTPDERSKKMVQVALEKMKFQSATKLIFRQLRSSISEKTKYDIMRMYTDKYGLTALPFISEEAFKAGSVFDDPLALKTKHPDLYSFGKALAYGLSRYGDLGFSTCVLLVARTEGMSDPNKKQVYPLVVWIASTSVYAMIKNKQIDPVKALKILSDLIQHKDVKPTTKEFYMRWAFTIDPESSCTLMGSASTPSETKAQINLHIQAELKGKVSCS